MTLEDGGSAREFDYDLFTIGAGSGGVRASRLSANYGARVAIAEMPLAMMMIATDDLGGAGGTCVIRGCVPKKLLVYGSQFRHGAAAAHKLVGILQAVGFAVERQIQT